MALNKIDLIKWFEDGCKKKTEFKIGTEHEKFVYKLSNDSRLKKKRMASNNVPEKIWDIVEQLEVYWKGVRS